MTDERSPHDKLPRWARQEIARLEAQVREQGDRLAFLEAKRPPTRVEITQGPSFEPANSSDDSTVRFVMGDRNLDLRQNWIDVSLAWTHKGGRFPFAVQLRASSGLSVALDSSNSALVMLFENAGAVAKAFKP